MAGIWQEQGSGVVTVAQSGIGPARLLGLPFAAAGGWFLYQFAGGLLHPGELTIAGWIMLPVMAAVFLVPGWIILFGRKRTRIDVTRREATEEFDFLIFARRKTTRIPLDAHVMLRYESGSSRSNLFYTHVYLVPDDAARILVGLFPASNKAAGMELAQKLAALLAIPVQDRCVEKGDVGPSGVVVAQLDPEDAD